MSMRMDPLELLTALSRDTSNEGREVFSDAVNEMSLESLDRTIRPLVEDLRGPDARRAA